MSVTTPTSPLTLLQAVNEMLAAVGTAQVMTLDAASTNEEVQKAVATISDVAVQVQSKGWHFNTDEDFPIDPDPAAGTITLPLGSLWLGLGYKSRDRRATVRNGMVYDLQNHTFVWVNGTAVVSPTPSPLTAGTLYCNLQFNFPFEQLPQPINWLIMAQAGRMWGVGRVPDTATYKFTDAVYEDALAAAIQWDQDSRQEFAEDNPHLQFMRKR